MGILSFINAAINGKYDIGTTEGKNPLNFAHLLKTIKEKPEFYAFEKSLKLSNETLKKLDADI